MRRTKTQPGRSRCNPNLTCEQHTIKVNSKKASVPTQRERASMPPSEASKTVPRHPVSRCQVYNTDSRRRCANRPLPPTELSFTLGTKTDVMSLSATLDLRSREGASERGSGKSRFSAAPGRARLEFVGSE